MFCQNFQAYQPLDNCCCPTAGGSVQQNWTFTLSAIKTPEGFLGAAVQVGNEVLAKLCSQLLFIPLPRQTKSTRYISCATLEL